LRIAEVDLQTCINLQARVLSHLGSLVPSQRSSQLLGQGSNRARDCLAYSFGSMAGERRTILYASFLTVTYHARQVQQHGEPRLALDQGSNGGAAKTENEITFPVSWLIMISDDTKFLPLRRVRALGIRSTRPVRRQAVSSRRNAPRPWTNKAW
jgi:hypothetical protein